MGIRKRVSQANYLKVNDVWEFLGFTMTSLTESPNPQTSSKRYVGNASATQSITSYEWSTDFEGDQIESDAAIEYIRNIGEMCLTGSDAETEYLIVDLDKEATTNGAYRARKFGVAIQVDEFADNDGELQLSGSFLGLTDPTLVTFTKGTKAITDGFTAAALEALTVTSIAGATTGTTDITVSPTLTSGNSYVYKLGTSLSLPAINATITGYTVWDGTSDITATAGQQILVVEINSSNQAKKAGITTVTIL